MKKTKKQIVHCEKCGCSDVKFRQFSPDRGYLYFCSKAHADQFFNSHAYRALPTIELIK